mmetsp:Transcript_5958/g.17416  ORF Transcript_5958/g.17416 Transcript_5958/m.17416 type:complete len:215 (-) Transcript_5958:365-1009(-)
MRRCSCISIVILLALLILGRRLFQLFEDDSVNILPDCFMDEVHNLFPADFEERPWPKLQDVQGVALRVFLHCLEQVMLAAESSQNIAPVLVAKELLPHGLAHRINLIKVGDEVGFGRPVVLAVVIRCVDGGKDNHEQALHRRVLFSAQRGPERAVLDAIDQEVAILEPRLWESGLGDAEKPVPKSLVDVSSSPRQDLPCQVALLAVLGAEDFFV